MAIRKTTLVIKNSDIINRPLPSTLLKGEGIVNTADGIMYFSGVTQSTNGWTPAGTGTTANFFEVGSNLYDLQLRNRITKYEGISGSGLVGKFLSGTTNGFVLSDISSIAGIDTYVTAFTYSNNVATIKQNYGQPDLSILINTMTGLTVNGTLSATTGNFNSVTSNSISATSITATTIYANGANITGLPYVTGGTANNTAHTYTFTNSTGGTFTVVGLTDIVVTGGTSNDANHTYTFTNNTGGTFTVVGLTDIVVTGGTYSSGNATFTNNTGGTFTVTGFTTTDTFVTGFTYGNNVFTIKQNQGQSDLTALINTMTGLTVNGIFSATTYAGLPIDIRVTGGTYSSGNGTATYTNNTGGTFNVSGFFKPSDDKYTTGSTLIGTTAYFDRTDALSAYTLDLSTFVAPTDTYTTGFTYTAGQNKLTISQNQGQPDLNVFITSVSGLTVSNLTAGRVVYVGTSGLLTDEAGFTYNDGTNTLSTPSDGTMNVGTGGLNVAGNTIIQGSLTVFGPSISAFTSQLYVEDPNVIFNYNPTGSTIAISVGAGLTIQDGNGITGGSVTLEIRPMDTFTGLTPTQIPAITEYTSAIGFANRAWVTQLNDIVIRSTNAATPNGVRVLTEFDVLDGMTY